MKTQAKTIEVRFFETAEFHVTPMQTWLDGDDCDTPQE